MAHHKNKDQTEGVLPVKISLTGTVVFLALQRAVCVTGAGQAQTAASSIFTKRWATLQINQDSQNQTFPKKWRP